MEINTIRKNLALIVTWKNHVRFIPSIETVTHLVSMFTTTMSS